jgi:bifunctional non-homologous end joining protein LigD
MPKVLLTHLDKVFWPREGYTKGDVVRYYERIADAILPYLRDRPLVLNRHPDGIRGASFFQKNVDPKRLPPYVRTVAIRARSTGRLVHYVVCNNKATLIYLANLGCIEMHPGLARTRRLNNPDHLVIDLDPHGTPFPQVAKVARMVRKVIVEAGGDCMLKTSGITGLHIYVRLGGRRDFDAVRSVAKLICRIVSRRLPKLTSFAHRPTGKGRVYLDYGRNATGQTLAAPYSLRAYPGATVSTPIEWSELSAARPGRYTIRTVPRRLKGSGDPWARARPRSVNLERLEKRLLRLADA